MGLLNTLFGKTQPTQPLEQKFTADLVSTPLQDKICPSCQSPLPREVKAKSTCPNCKKLVFKRTVPESLQEVNVDEENAEKVDLEWARINGRLDIVLEEKSRYEEMSKKLEAKFGKKPDKNDILWGISNENIQQALKVGSYDDLAGAYLNLGVICEKEKRWIECIVNYALCGYFSTKEYINESIETHIPYAKEELKVYHFMDTSPVRRSLQKLGKTDMLEKLIHLIQDPASTPSSLVSEVRKLLE